MRLSPQRHTLAVLRLIIGLTQKELARLLECSTATIQAIELGKLKMSPKFAANVGHKTGVRLHWLLNNDVTQPPLDPDDKPYTRQTFDETQAFLHAPPQDSSDVRVALFVARVSFRTAVEQLAYLYARVYKQGTLQLCNYRVINALSDELRRAGIDITTLSPEEKHRLFKYRLAEHNLSDLLAPVRRFVDETDAIFQKQIAQFEPTPPGGKHPASARDLPPGFPKVSGRKKPTVRPDKA